MINKKMILQSTLEFERVYFDMKIGNHTSLTICMIRQIREATPIHNVMIIKTLHANNFIYFMQQSLYAYDAYFKDCL